MKNLIMALVMVVSLAFSSNAFCGDYLFVSLEFPPLEYIGDNKEPTGIAVDVVKTIINSLGHTVTVKIYPWARALKMTETGKADAIFTAYKNPERETFLDYSKSVIVHQTVYFYRKKGSSINYDGDLKKLRPYRIGVVSTISYGKKFDEAKSMLQLDRVNKLEQNIKKLMIGRIDLTLSNAYVGDYELKKMSLQDQIEKIPTQIQSIPSYIAFSKVKKLTALRNQFDIELEKMKQSGEYAKILKQYGVEF